MRMAWWVSWGMCIKGRRHTTFSALWQSAVMESAYCSPSDDARREANSSVSGRERENIPNAVIVSY